MIKRTIYLVQKNKKIELGADQLTIENIGGKAMGLCQIPVAWSVPFFIVSQELYSEYNSNKDKSVIKPYIKPIKDVIQYLKIGDEVILRSSAVNEGMKERGSFDSVQTSINNIESSLLELLDKLTGIPNDGMPIIVQRYIKPIFTGHMSNERRFSQDSRDWKIEKYLSNGSYEQDTVGIRSWRTKYNINEITQKVLYGNSKNSTSKMQEIASYWYDLSKSKKCRFHLEFVYDGEAYYIVQADRDYPNKNAINPKLYDIKVHAPTEAWIPKILKKFNPNEQTPYKKLQNVKNYHELGFRTVPLYYLDDVEALSELKDGVICDGLKEDLETLLNIQSVVIRMDINLEDQAEKQMLPRSNEICNYNNVTSWLKQHACDILGKGIFIFHNFVPATAAAFAHATPNGRLIKIQSLWGLPEGLYYNYHDTIIVDLGTNNIDTVSYDNVKVTIKNKYKDTFIFPDANGAWIAGELQEPYDWKCSIESNESIFDIAVKSQKLSNEVKEEISIMWFVGIDKDFYGVNNMPWFHEKVSLQSSYTVDEYKRKYFLEEEIIINNSDELEKLISSGDLKNTKCFRIKPNSEKDLRNKELIENIGHLAHKHGITILLDGTQLTHSYYQLKKTRAHVVCSNHDELTYSDTLEFNKLVRDNIPEKIISNGEHVKCSIVARPLFDRMLLEKLLEEAYEVYDAKSDTDIMSELADMLEICKTIQRLNRESPISCYDMLNNRSKSFRDDYYDLKSFKFVNAPVNFEPFTIGGLYGSLLVQRQKTLYRVEFNLQNYPATPKGQTSPPENEQTLKLKKEILSLVSTALKSRISEELMSYVNQINNYIDILSKHLGYSIEAVAQKASVKSLKVGGFDKGYILIQSALKDNIIDDDKEFNPQNCSELFVFDRDFSKYIEFLQNQKTGQKRILCRFTVPIAVNSWEIIFDSPKIKQLLSDTQCLLFYVQKNSSGELILTVKTHTREEFEQMSLL